MGNSNSQPITPSAVPQSTSQEELDMPKSADSSDVSDASDEYEVEAVLGREFRNGKFFYQLKWKGYDKPTWEPESVTDTCKELINAFDKAHPSPLRAAHTGSRLTSKGSTSKKTTRDSSSVSDSPVPSSRRGRASATTTPSNGRTRNPRPSSSAQKSRVVRASSTSSQESQTPSKKTQQKRPATSGKRVPRKVSSSSESEKEEEEREETPKSSRKPGRPPSKLQLSSPKKTPSKRKRDSSSLSSKDSESEGESETSEQRGAGKRRKRGSTRKSLSMDEDTPEQVTPRRGGRVIKEKKGPRSSSRKTVPLRSYVQQISSDEDEEEKKKKKAVAKSPTRSPRKEPVRAALVVSSDSDEEEEKKRSAPRSATKSARKEPARTAVVASSESGEEEAPTSSARRSISLDGDKKAVNKLVAALTEALVVEPFVVPVKYSSGKPLKSKASAAAPETILPVKIFKPEDLPGIETWTVESYEEEYSLEADFKQEIEKFAGREVQKVVGYCLHPTYPNVLVHLAKKKNEKDLPVKQAVQSVHVPLAARLFPKAFADYVNRMALMSQYGDKPSESASTSNGKGKKGK